MTLPNRKGAKVRRTHDGFEKYIIGGSLKAKKWYFNAIELEPIYVRTYKEIQGIEHDVREAHSRTEVYRVVLKLKKHDFLTAGLSLDSYSNLSALRLSLVDKALRRYEWDGSSYLSPSRYGGELGLDYPTDSDDRKTLFANRTNLEYLLSEQYSLSLNTLFTLANGYPHDALREQALGRQTAFPSRMRSLVAGLSYDYRSPKDKFLNSFTLRYYRYTMHTEKAHPHTGIRRYIDLDKSEIGLSNALRYRFTPTLMGKLSAGYDVRIPSESELLGDGVSITPSEALTPERNTSANVGLLYDLTAKHPTNAQIELNFFYNHLEDMIRYTEGLLGAQYVNFGQMRTIGVEFEAKADVSPSLYVYGNTTYQDLRDKRETEPLSHMANPTYNKRMPNIPYLLANAGVEYHRENLFGGRGKNTRLMLDLAFVEEYYYDFELTRLQKRRIPRHTTLDVGFEHSLRDRHLFLSGKVRNLTNAETYTELNRPLPGINWAVKLRVIF